MHCIALYTLLAASTLSKKVFRLRCILVCTLFSLISGSSQQDSLRDLARLGPLLRFLEGLLRDGMANDLCNSQSLEMCGLLPQICKIIIITNQDKMNFEQLHVQEIFMRYLNEHDNERTKNHSPSSSCSIDL